MIIFFPFYISMDFVFLDGLLFSIRAKSSEDSGFECLKLVFAGMIFSNAAPSLAVSSSSSDAVSSSISSPAKYYDFFLELIALAIPRPAGRIWFNIDKYITCLNIYYMLKDINILNVTF